MPTLTQVVSLCRAYDQDITIRMYPTGTSAVIRYMRADLLKAIHAKGWKLEMHYGCYHIRLESLS